MSYAYSNGDGLSVLDSATPNGATEPISNLDDAIRQVKAYLKDTTAGVAKIQTDLDAITEPTTLIATMGSAQSIAAGAGVTIVQFNTESVDTQAAFNSSTYEFTAPTAGLYQVILSLEAAMTASAGPADIMHKIFVYIGGISAAEFWISRGASTGDTLLAMSRIFQLSAGQVLTVRYSLAVSAGTMTVNVGNTSTKNILQINRLSA